MKIENLILYGLAGIATLSLIKSSTKSPASSGKSSADIEDKVRFLRAMKPVAEAVYKQYGIKTTITMSQSALESNWGVSGLTRDANNLFGIKANTAWIEAGKPVWTGNTIEYLNPNNTYQASKVQASFRAYANYEESALDWGRLIATSTRYANLYKFAKAGNVSAFGEEVTNSGYATDPFYQDKFVSVSKVVAQYV